MGCEQEKSLPSHVGQLRLFFVKNTREEVRPKMPEWVGQSNGRIIEFNENSIQILQNSMDYSTCSGKVVINRGKPLDNAEIGMKIKQLRKQRGLTQEELAEMIVEEQSLISRIESGRKANLTIDLLQRIAGALNVTVNELCYDSDELKRDKILEAVNIFESLSEDKMDIVLMMLKALK